ncbi:GNAT family N-acetyltransferase [Nocardioides sp. ChNu-153]|uniref:GNAT family N-acetyltransferase n=1 Tax=unclassified Nocardioides TaxID=2615069 RepID=UPI0024062F31|nr:MULTISPECIES: GNAT family N-acetyltransferase [unclassified Nocardioides]MDF9717649.1 GNAT family N-acetyltransferase [Nocardioides sp. ChNu-99]MDN7120771.1 GNAT family N-acetyltransferase [Nocardioides sp. ChNu-153]
MTSSDPLPAPFTVSPLAPGDEEALRTWWEVEHASVTAQDPTAPHRTLEALRATRDAWGEFEDGVLLAAHDEDGTMVGVAELCWPLTDNTHLVEFDVHVLPAHRRRGAGRVLWEEMARRTRELGRTTIAGEVTTPAGGDAPGVGFTEALGVRTVLVEDHLALPLPVDPAHLERLGQEALAAAAGYDVVTWTDRCPDDLVDAFCTMRTRMNQDVPTGDADVEAVVVTPERLRREEDRRRAASYTTITAAARRVEDGTMAGYTVLVLQPGEQSAYQGDTLVMPEHRGRRLGTLLKLTTIEVVAEEHPERTSVHTWVATDNAPMQAVNRAFGFVLVDREHVVEARVD